MVGVSSVLFAAFFTMFIPPHLLKPTNYFTNSESDQKKVFCQFLSYEGVIIQTCTRIMSKVVTPQIPYLCISQIYSRTR